jgi:hypothetical protein
MSESQGPSPREMGSASLGAALAVILGAATGPLAPVTAAMATPLTTRMMELIFSEWGRKSNVVTAAAMQASGLGPDEFCGILADDPALMGLAQRILWAASISGHEHKLRVLGGLLGGAVASRGDKLDETGLIVAALADIDVPHTVVLEVLTRPTPDEDGQKRQTAGALSGGFSIPPPRSGTDLMTWEPGAWLPEQIQNELPLPPGFVLACLSVLTRHGLAQTVGTYGGGQRFKITGFGQAMLEAMGLPDAAGTGDSGQPAAQ